MARIRIEASVGKPRESRVIDTETGADLTSIVRAVNLRIGPENHHSPVITLELLDAGLIVDGQVVGVTVPENLPRVKVHLPESAANAAHIEAVIASMARDAANRILPR